MKKNIFWKSIFLLTFIETVWFCYQYLKGFPGWSIRDFLNLIILLPAIYGIFLFTFKKKIHSRKFWKYFFVYYIIDAILTLLFFIPRIAEVKIMQILYKTKVIFDMPSNPVMCLCLVSLILLIPQIYILFRLGFPKK